MSYTCTGHILKITCYFVDKGPTGTIKTSIHSNNYTIILIVTHILFWKPMPMHICQVNNKLLRLGNWYKKKAFLRYKLLASLQHYQFQQLLGHGTLLHQIWSSHSQDLQPMPRQGGSSSSPTDVSALTPNHFFPGDDQVPTLLPVSLSSKICPYADGGTQGTTELMSSSFPLLRPLLSL